MLCSILSHSFRECHLAFLKIQLDLLRRAEDRRTVVVELAFPSGDNHGGEAVADEVYTRAAHEEESRK